MKLSLCRWAKVGLGAVTLDKLKILGRVLHATLLCILKSYQNLVKFSSLFFHSISGIIRLILCDKSLRKFHTSAGILGDSFLRSVFFLLHWNISIVDCFTLFCRYDGNTNLWQQIRLASGLES